MSLLDLRRQRESQRESKFPWPKFHQFSHDVLGFPPFSQDASLAAEVKLRKSWAAQETEELEALRSGEIVAGSFVDF